MNKTLSDITSIFGNIASLGKRYRLILFVIAIGAVYGFLAYRINSLTQTEPSQEAVTEKLKTAPRPRIDQDAIDKMQQLEEENIEIKTLFDEARNNPFSE